MPVNEKVVKAWNRDTEWGKDMDGHYRTFRGHRFYDFESFEAFYADLEVTTQYHPLTGEIIRCKFCDKKAYAFAAHIFPLCFEHAKEYESLAGGTWDRFRKMKKEVRSQK